MMNRALKVMQFIPAIGSILVIVFTGVVMTYMQKINFAAQIGAQYAAQLVGPESFFLGAPKPSPNSPGALMSASADQIQTAVRQTLISLGVPGGASARVMSASPDPAKTGGVPMAQIEITIGGFAIPSLPPGFPLFSGMSVAASAPYNQPANTPPAVAHLTFWYPGNVGNHKGSGNADGEAWVPVYNASSIPMHVPVQDYVVWSRKATNVFVNINGIPYDVAIPW